MPFTPSHAVVALPFLRTPLVPAAIAIGAMTPDLPLFLRGTGLTYGFTHSDGNVVWTTLVALALFFVWRGLLRPAAGDLLPQPIARRLPADWRRRPVAALQQAAGVGEPAGYPVLLAVSCLMGVISHILWDRFTHADRAGVEWLPILAEHWGPLPGYTWLQHGSSIVGLAIIAIAALLWFRRTAPDADARSAASAWIRVTWWLALPVVLVVAWVIGVAQLGPFTAEFTVRHLAYRVLPPACAIWGALTLMLCAAIALIRPRDRRIAA